MASAVEHDGQSEALSNIVSQPSATATPEEGNPSGGDDALRLVEWDTHSVKPAIRDALAAPYRGQIFGADHLHLLSVFNDIPVYVNSINKAEETPTKNVRTQLMCKFDSGLKTTVVYARINSGKL
ncbi:hypothetical protein CYMTET_50411 [Cymbomonas tetramitiformis]|uniref:Uncharacterized protein n=1 Tax=Cymbomonas tetramitiformis TaxID=36881 RepID=A0AAE0ETI1_9CHLO|nr:hypothetical protein CYMTET_50411 [Cymbomonas tetramitiformis]